MPTLTKYLLLIGALLILAGLVYWLFGDKLIPKAFGRLGKLPGDIHVESENGGFYFPIVTCILLSLVLSLIVWLARRFL
jgi:hypothetical protein